MNARVSAARWFIVLSPEGAARSAGEETIKAFSLIVNPGNLKTFDCKVYLDAFKNMLKDPDEAMVVDLLNHALTVQCLAFKATHMLVLALSPVTLFTLNLLREQKVATIHWFYEDFRQAGYWKDVLAGYQYFFAIQKGPIIDECRKLGTRYAFLPTAASEIGPDKPFTQSGINKDAAFIGIPSVYRIRVLEFLAAHGVRLAIAGQGWDRYQGPLMPFIVNGGWIDGKQSAAVLQSAAIGINLSINDPQLDRSNTHISPRIFDVLLSGRVLITEEAPLVHEVLPDCTFHCFSNETEALDCIRMILARPEMEKENRAKNRQVVEQGHLYVNRVRRMVEITG
jgi:Glycosyl transferases group 1